MIGSVLWSLVLNRPWSMEAHVPPVEKAAEWPLPEALAALIDLIDHHQFAYEDSTLSILYVTDIPGILEPIPIQWGRYFV